MNFQQIPKAALACVIDHLGRNGVLALRASSTRYRNFIHTYIAFWKKYWRHDGSSRAAVGFTKKTKPNMWNLPDRVLLYHGQIKYSTLTWNRSMCARRGTESQTRIRNLKKRLDAGLSYAYASNRPRAPLSEQITLEMEIKSTCRDQLIPFDKEIKYMKRWESRVMGHYRKAHPKRERSERKRIRLGSTKVRKVGKRLKNKD